MEKRIERGNAKQTMSNACQFDLIMSGICNKWVKPSVDSVFASLHTHLQLLLFATPLPTGQHSVALIHLSHFQPQLISRAVCLQCGNRCAVSTSRCAAKNVEVYLEYSWTAILYYLFVFIRFVIDMVFAIKQFSHLMNKWIFLKLKNKYTVILSR